MLTQSELIDMARAKIAEREGRTEPVTFYRVGKELGITSSYMVALAKTQRIMSAEFAHKLAVLAEVSPAYAMACIEAERASRDDLATSGTWKMIAESLSGKAASILLLACMGIGAAHEARAAGNAGFLAHSPADGARAGMYIMSNRRRRLLRSLGQRFRNAVTPPALLSAQTI